MNAPSQQTANHQAENIVETEVPNHNRNAMSVAQLNHGTHDIHHFILVIHVATIIAEIAEQEVGI